MNKNFKVKNGLDVTGTATATKFSVAGAGDLEVLPTKTGNSGKYLTTDGSSLSWSGASGFNVDGGIPSSTYGGLTAIDGGSV